MPPKKVAAGQPLDGATTAVTTRVNFDRKHRNVAKEFLSSPLSARSESFGRSLSDLNYSIKGAAKERSKKAVKLPRKKKAMQNLGTKKGKKKAPAKARKKRRCSKYKDDGEEDNDDDDLLSEEDEELPSPKRKKPARPKARRESTYKDRKASSTSDDDEPSPKRKKKARPRNKANEDNSSAHQNKTPSQRKNTPPAISPAPGEVDHLFDKPSPKSKKPASPQKKLSPMVVSPGPGETGFFFGDEEISPKTIPQSCIRRYSMSVAAEQNSTPTHEAKSPPKSKITTSSKSSKAPKSKTEILPKSAVAPKTPKIKTAGISKSAKRRSPKSPETSRKTAEKLTHVITLTKSAEKRH